jgi:hypothetical protein
VEKQGSGHFKGAFQAVHHPESMNYPGIPVIVFSPEGFGGQTDSVFEAETRGHFSLHQRI